MKISAIKKFIKEDFIDAPEWFGRFMDEINIFSDQIITMTENNITFNENVLCQPIEFSFTHGVQQKFENKLSGKPRGIIVTESSGYAIDSYELRYDNSGKIGIILYFKTNESSVIAYKTADQPIPSATGTQVTYNTSTQSGDGIFFSSNSVVCKIPGRYVFSYKNIWEPDNAGNRYSYIKLNTGASALERYAVTFSPPCQGGNYTGQTGTQTIDLNAGDTVSIQSLQNKGVDLNLIGTAPWECIFTAHSLNYNIANVPCKLYVLG